MKERPILFSGEMIRAIRAGRKSQTRRVVKPSMTAPRVAPQHMEPWLINGEQETDDDGLLCWLGFHPEYPGDAKWFTCPYGQPGDRLWVRETWAVDAPLDQVRRAHEDLLSGIGYGPYYRADQVHENTGLTWRPSIHMPRWVSRITLEITGIRVERVQDISAADKAAEGLTENEGYGLAAFEDLWNAINAKRGYGWDVNPWVWAIEFKQV